MSPHLKSSLRHLIISFIILSPVMFCLYFCFDLLGFSFLKIQSGALLQTGLRALFRLVGWECLGPVMILLCVVSGLGLAHDGSQSRIGRRSTCCGASPKRAFRRIDLGLEKVLFALSRTALTVPIYRRSWNRRQVPTLCQRYIIHMKSISAFRFLRRENITIYPLRIIRGITKG